MTALAAALMLVGATGVVRAQELTIGVHGGVNLARAGSDDSDANLSPFPLFGASAELGFGGLGLRVQLEYLRRGGRVTVIPPGQPETESTFAVSYLAIPVNLRYQVGFGAVGGYLFGGTTVGALLAAERRLSGGEEEDVKGELSAIAITLDLGGGLSWRVSPAFALLLDVRYSAGLRDAARGDEVLETGAWKARDIKVALGVTYTFGARPAAPQMPMSMPYAPMPLAP
jgi:hypothetical protein